MRYIQIILGGALLLAQSASAQPTDGAAHGGAALVVPENMSFGPAPPVLPAGARGAVIYGNPAEAGPFVMRLVLPANYRIPPHTHPADESITVLSGTFNLGTGEAFERESTTPLGPGSFAVVHRDMPHFVWTDVETTIQLHGVGPWSLRYVNPADDPRGESQ